MTHKRLILSPFVANEKLWIFLWQQWDNYLKTKEISVIQEDLPKNLNNFGFFRNEHICACRSKSGKPWWSNDFRLFCRNRGIMMLWLTFCITFNSKTYIDLPRNFSILIWKITRSLAKHLKITVSKKYQKGHEIKANHWICCMISYFILSSRSLIKPFPLHCSIWSLRIIQC